MESFETTRTSITLLSSTKPLSFGEINDTVVPGAVFTGSVVDSSLHEEKRTSMHKIKKLSFNTLMFIPDLSFVIHLQQKQRDYT
jgi:hypothetical protein